MGMEVYGKNPSGEVGATAEFIPAYSPWRHGGWYVDNVRYPSGAVGCVSRNYPDKKWRIVCDKRPHAYELHTYPSRDAAARAERELALTEAVTPARYREEASRSAPDRVWPRCSCGWQGHETSPCLAVIAHGQHAKERHLQSAAMTDEMS